MRKRVLGGMMGGGGGSLKRVGMKRGVEIYARG